MRARDKIAAIETEEAYESARDQAWNTYRMVVDTADQRYQRDEISAGELMLARDAAHAELDGTLSAARKAAGYGS